MGHFLMTLHLNCRLMGVLSMVRVHEYCTLPLVFFLISFSLVSSRYVTKLFLFLQVNSCCSFCVFSQQFVYFFHHFVLTTRTTQPHPQVFSVNSSISWQFCRTHDTNSSHICKILPNLVDIQGCCCQYMYTYIYILTYIYIKKVKEDQKCIQIPQDITWPRGDTKFLFEC